MNAILQVRDIPEDIVSRLRQKAKARGISLSAYVRQLLTVDAEQATMDEAVERIATRQPIDISDDDIIAAIHEGRR